MVTSQYDIVTVGGGLGGSALAKVLAEHDARVLVVERERQFSDRIRGEWIAPWGVHAAPLSRRSSGQPAVTPMLVVIGLVILELPLKIALVPK